MFSWLCGVCVVFFKQKTAYEMRISDWSSDVCSSDLGRQLAERYRESEERFRTLNDLLPALVLMARADDGRIVYANEAAAARLGRGVADGATLASLFEDPAQQSALAAPVGDMRWNNVDALLHTLGQEIGSASCRVRVRPCRSRCSPDNYKNNIYIINTDISIYQLSFNYITSH